MFSGHLNESELAISLQESLKKIEIGEAYVSYKDPTKPYIVLHVGLWEETEEPSIVYQALYGEKLIWIRPLTKFLEPVEHGGEMVPRFRRL